MSIERSRRGTDERGLARNSLLLAATVGSLTARQKYLIAVLGCSDSLGEAASTLGIHASALSAKLRAVAHRLDLKDTAELVAMARRNQILDAASDAIYGIDPVGTCVFANSSATAMFGYERGEMVGSEIHYLIHGRNLDGSRLAAQDCPLHQVAIGAISEHTAETVMWHRDGRPRWVVYRAATGGEAEDQQVAVVTLTDVTHKVRAQWELSLSETQLEMALEAAGIAAFRVDLRNEIIAGWGNLLPLAEGISYERFLDAVHPDDRHKVSLRMANALQPGSVTEEDIVVVTPSGEQRSLRSRMKLVADSSGEPAILLGAAIDTTAQRDAERMYQTFLDVAIDAFIRTDACGAVIEWNRAAQTIFGYHKEQAVGRQLEELIIPSRYRDDYRRVMDRAVSGSLLEPRVHGRIETSALRSDGTEVPVEATFAAIPINGGVAFQHVLRDISEKKAAEARLLEHAVIDPMTGLANRLLLQDRLTQALAKLRRASGHIAVLFIDIDRLKLINETMGHSAGDRLIREAAERIQASIRPGDTAASFGSDQFVLVCENLDEHQALEMASTVLTALALPFHLDGYELRVTASIGIALTDRADTDPDHLLRDADAAMCRAKQKGRARAEIFNIDIRKRALKRLKLEAGLRHALDSNELLVRYQPVVDTATERITSLEALVRWRHPQRGLLGPDEFIRVAEETGLIVRLGEQVLSTACHDLAAWEPNGDLKVAVNLSARQLAHPAIVETVSAVLHDTGIGAGRLYLELTETALTEDDAIATLALERLHELGVRIAVDDFGTGYSSLLRLRRFPISLLKLDRQFVAGLGRNSDDTAIVAASVQLANSLGIASLAEGVERPDQLRLLRSMGCQQAQGYLWSPPVGADEVPGMVDNRARAAG